MAMTTELNYDFSSADSTAHKCILDIEPSYRIDFYAYLEREDHDCLVNDPDYFNCHFYDSCHKEGMSHAEYLTSPSECAIFEKALVQSDVVCESILKVKDHCTISWLAEICGMDAWNYRGYTSIFFWRLFKRLFYARFQFPLPNCIWKTVAHVFKTSNKHPSVMEDLVFCMWTALHPKAILQGRMYLAHKRIFSFDNVYRIETRISNTLSRKSIVWIRGEKYDLEKREREDVTRFFKQKVTQKQRVCMTISEWDMFKGLNETQMFRMNPLTQENTDKLNAAVSDTTDTLGHISRQALDITRELADASLDVKGIAQNLSQAAAGMNTFTMTAKQGWDEVIQLLKDSGNRFNDEILAKAATHMDYLKNTIDGEIIGCGAQARQTTSDFGKTLEAGTMGVYKMLGHKVLLVCEAFCLYTTRDFLPPWLWYMLLAHRVIAWFNLGDILSRMFTWIYGLIPTHFYRGTPEEEPMLNLNEAQAFEEFNWTTIISGTILGAIYLYVHGTLPQKNMTEKFLKTLDASFSINRGMEHFPKLFEKVDAMVNSAVNFVWKGSVPNADLRDEFDKYEAQYKIWSSEVSKLAQNSNRMQLEYDDELRDKILKLRDEANVYVKLFSHKAWPQRYRATFQMTHKLCLELADKVDHAKQYKAFRFDPFCIWISGGVRIGKSFACTDLCMDLAGKLNMPMTNCVYSRSETDHFDKYTGNPWIYYDDFGQWRGTTAENRLKEYIAMRSNNPYVTPQASVDDKGRVFSSFGIMISSNYEYIDTTPVHSDEAVHGRRHACYKAFLKPEFMDKRIGLPDKNKIFEANKAAPDEFPHLTFARFQPLPTPNIPTSGNMTYQQVVSECFYEFTEHKKQQEYLIERYYSKLAAKQQDKKVRDAIQGEVNRMKKTWERQGWDGAADLLTRVNQAQSGYRIKLKNVTHERLRKVLEGICEVDEHGEQYYDFSENDYKLVSNFEWIEGELRMKATGVDIMTGEFASWLDDFFLKMAAEVQGAYFALALGDKGPFYKLEENLAKKAKLLTGYDEMSDKFKEFKNVTAPSWKKKVKDFWANDERMRELKDKLATLVIVGGVVMLGYAGYKMMCDTTVPKTYNTKDNPKTAEIRVDKRTKVQVPEHIPGDLDNERVRNFAIAHNMVVDAENAKPPNTAEGWNPFYRKAVVVDFGHVDKTNIFEQEDKIVDAMNHEWMQHRDFPKPTTTVEDVERLNLGRAEWLRRHVVPAEMGPSGDQRTSKAPKSKVVSAHNQAQSADDQNALEIRDRKVMPCLYHLEVDEKFWVHGLAFDGQNLLVPYHAIHGREYKNIRLHGRDSLKPIEFQLNPWDVYRFTGHDVAVIRNIRRLPPAPKLSKYFIREMDLADYKKFNGELISKQRGSPVYEAYGTKVMDVDLLGDIQRCHAYETEIYTVRVGWRHFVPTKLGYCGSPLMAHGPHFARKIVGVHVSGIDKGENGGLATLVTQEMLVEALAVVGLEGEVCHSHGFTDTNQAQCESLVVDEVKSTFVDQGYITHGCVAPQNAEFAAVKTSIKKSAIFGLVEPAKTEPAILSTYDPRNKEKISPFRKALLKYTRRTRPFDCRDRARAKDYLHQQHIKHIKPLKDVAFTDAFEIINGDPMIEQYKQLEMDSSAGYPWKKKKPAGETGKRFCFEEIKDYDKMRAYMWKEDLRDAVIDNLQQLQRGERPFNIWVHCLKDERRPIAKVYDVKTRIFTMAPVSWTLTIRALTMHFTAAFYAANTNFYSCVGIDPYSMEWTKLYRRLRQAGRRAGDGDYGQYDGTLDPDLMMDGTDLIFKWYEYHLNGRPLKIDLGHGLVIEMTIDQLEKAFEIMGVDFVHTVQLVFNILHQKCQGNPSGNPLTVLLNSIVGALYLLLAFISLYRAAPDPKPEIRLVDYDKYVKDAIYGDDNGYTVHPSADFFFTPAAITEFFDKYGIEYTTADKSGRKQDWKDVDDIRFLKNGFRSHDVYPYMKLATMDKDTITELTNWQRYSADDDEQLRVQCDNALRFAYFHGKEYYVSLLAKINAALQSVNILGFPDDYDEMDREFTRKFWQ